MPLIPFWLMQSLARFARARLHAWQWQMSMEARPEQLPDLHGGWLVFISGWHCVNAGRGRFTVMCRRGSSWPRLPDGDAARVRLQLTPGRDNREVNLFHHSWINHSRVMSIIFSMVTVQICNNFLHCCTLFSTWNSFHLWNPTSVWLLWFLHAP